MTTGWYEFLEESEFPLKKPQTNTGLGFVIKAQIK